MAFNMSSTSLSTCVSTLSLSLVVLIFMPSGANLGTRKSPLFLIFLNSSSMLKSCITSSTWLRMSAMYCPYTLHAFTALSFDSSDFFLSSIKISAYKIQSWRYCQYLFSISSKSMQSVGAAIFLILGIIFSSSIHIPLVSGSFCSFLANSSRSNSSCWHGMPMSSG